MKSAFDPEKPGQEGREPQARDRQPFDTSALDDIPQPRSDDPPYRDWWTVEKSERDERGR